MLCFASQQLRHNTESGQQSALLSSTLPRRLGAGGGNAIIVKLRVARTPRLQILQNVERL